MNRFLQKALDFIAGRSGYRETYASETTRFIQEYLTKHPEELDSQNAQGTSRFGPYSSIA